MPTIFSRVLAGELPGRFVWRDERCAAFLSIAPLRTGHVLVVPVEEVDHWIDCEPDLVAHLTTVAQHVGRAQQAVWSPRRIALFVVGEEVPHTHLHVVPMDSLADVNFANADPSPDPAGMDDAAEQLRVALRDLGHAAHVPDA